MNLVSYKADIVLILLFIVPLLLVFFLLLLLFLVKLVTYFLDHVGVLLSMDLVIEIVRVLSLDLVRILLLLLLKQEHIFQTLPEIMDTVVLFGRFNLVLRLPLFFMLVLVDALVSHWELAVVLLVFLSGSKEI